jgi:hypothetical protein
MTADEVRDALFRWTLNPEVEDAEDAIARMGLAFAVLEEVETLIEECPQSSKREEVVREIMSVARARLEADTDADA